MIDWQTLLVTLVMIAAAGYALRRVWLRLRSLLISRPLAAPSCGGCGSCGSTKSNPQTCGTDSAPSFISISRQ